MTPQRIKNTGTREVPDSYMNGPPTLFQALDFPCKWLRAELSTSLTFTQSEPFTSLKA